MTSEGTEGTFLYMRAGKSSVCARPRTYARTPRTHAHPSTWQKCLRCLRNLQVTDTKEENSEGTLKCLRSAFGCLRNGGKLRILKRCQ
jgi:hypothetical protein